MPIRKSIFRRLQPQYSLFGRILLWFWLAVTAMVLLAFVIARYANQTWQVSALNDEQLTKMSELTKNVQHLLDKNVELPKALRRMSARGRWNLMAIDSATEKVILGFPSPLLTQRANFIALIGAQQPLMVSTSNMEFAGPFLIVSQQQQFHLFIGHLLRREQRPQFAFGLAFIVFLVSGTLACIGIAWTIAKPIKELSKLSKQFAVGDAQALKRGKSKRKDELGQLHNDIYDMATNLAKSLAQQKALMANVSHELRTPLTRLQLAIAMLQAKGEEQIKYAQRIEKDIGIMDELIGQSLQLARMNDETQAQWLQIKSLHLNDILKPIIDDLSFEAKAQNVELIVQTYLDIELPLIQHSFISAVENVTRNAIKFCNKQVKFSVTTISAAQAKIDLPSHSATTFLLVTIEDDGKGLSDEQIVHIFEPFYRASSSQQFQGVGLGLTIAKAAMELHHGSIVASDSVLGGLKLCLYFPIQTDASLNPNDCSK